MRFDELRSKIDSISDPFERYVCKIYYLTGARANELAGEGQVEGKQGKTSGQTRPLCPTKANVDYDVFEGTEVLKLRLQIEKRKEDDGFKPLRTVALPLTQIEPWAVDVSSYIEDFGMNEPLVQINRQYLNTLFRRNQMYELALSLEENRKLTSLCNPLRHLRIHFLLDYYHMNPIEVVSMVGWKLSGNIAGGVSSELGRYAHLQWTQYFPKLLKPLPKSNSLPSSSP